MEIVDAQVHLNQLVPNWQTVDPDTIIATAVETMNAVGVDTVLIAESRGFDAQKRPLGEVLPNGAVRLSFPFSARAVELHPERFGYLMRVDINDPELVRLVGEIRTRPGALCLRVVPLPDTGEVDRLARGEWESLFAAAAEAGVPVFAWLPNRGHLLEPYLRAFPQLQVILDHCGVGVAPPHHGPVAPTLASSITPTRDERVAQLDRVLELAQYPNLALKWSHAPSLLSAQPYPHRDVPPLLRRAIDAFGPSRILWASDYTQARHETGRPWSEMLYYLVDSDALSEVEKSWILGRSVRQVLRWPKPQAAAPA